VGGQVVGINLAATWRNQPVTLALASDEVRPDLDQVLQGGQLTVASLGVDYLDLDSSEAALRSLPVGGLVRSVQPGGPAEQAGIKAGDVVTQLDDVKLDQARPLGQVLRTNYKPSQRVAVTLFRGGASTQVQATLVGQHPRCT
jgi:S1-C subfamily serine protease